MSVTGFVMGTREAKKAATRTAIFEAARALIEEHGAEAVTMRALAERAGVSVGTAHNYAGSRTQLIVELFVDELQGVMDRKTASLPDGALVDRLLHVFSGLFEVYAARPALARTYVTGAVFAPDDVFVHYQELTMTFIGVLADIVETSGELREDVAPMLAARLCFDTYIGVAVPFLRSDAPDVVAYRSLLRGLLLEVLALMRPAGPSPS